MNKRYGHKPRDDIILLLRRHRPVLFSICFELRKLERFMDGEDFVRLTDVWKQSGRTNARAPSKWARSDVGKMAIRSLAKELGVPETSLVSAARGRAYGLRVHKRLVPSYEAFIASPLKCAGPSERGPSLQGSGRRLHRV